jgi:alpha-beta hydrolase superfamily lysophospholipase
MARVGTVPTYDHPAINRSYFFPRAGLPLPAGGRGVPVALQTESAIRGYWHRSQPQAPTLHYFHGNGETAGDQRHWLEWSRALGVNLMLVDYPGYGASAGTPSLGACRRAARTAMDFLLAQPADEVPAVIAMGRSVGSIFALDAAASACGSPRLRGVILESGVADVMQRLETRVPLAQAGIDRERLVVDLRRDFDHRLKVAGLERPVLVLHTRHDTTVPSWHAERLAEWAGPRLHKLVLFERGDHNTIQSVNSAQYLAEIGSFLDVALGR